MEDEKRTVKEREGARKCIAAACSASAHKLELKARTQAQSEEEDENGANVS